MDLIISDSDFNGIGIIDNATSVIWTKRYYERGDFEIYIRANADTAEMLRDGHFVTRPDDDAIGIIEAIKITTSVEDGDYIIATGIMLDGITNRRVINTQTVVSGTPETCIRTLITNNCIKSRPFPNFRLDTNLAGIGGAHRAQYTGDNLYDAITDICKSHGIGSRVVLGNDGMFVFQLFRGVDRSENQTENPHVTFSAEFDNLANTEYTLDTAARKNFAYVAGEGEGRARKIATVSSGTPSGFGLREVWVDARDASTNDGEISESEYMEQLRTRGVEKMAEAADTESFTGEIVNAYTYVYGVDYALGDIVTVKDEYGHALDTRIIEVIESEDSTGRTIIPKFEGWG